MSTACNFWGTFCSLSKKHNAVIALQNVDEATTVTTTIKDRSFLKHQLVQQLCRQPCVAFAVEQRLSLVQWPETLDKCVVCTCHYTLLSTTRRATPCMHNGWCYSCEGIGCQMEVKPRSVRSDCSLCSLRADRDCKTVDPPYTPADFNLTHVSVRTAMQQSGELTKYSMSLFWN